MNKKVLGLIGLVGITTATTLTILNNKGLNTLVDASGTKQTITLGSSNFEFSYDGFGSYYFNITAKTAVTETDFGSSYLYGANNYLEAGNIEFNGCIFQAWYEGEGYLPSVTFNMAFDVYSPTGEPSVSLNGSYDLYDNSLTYKGTAGSGNKYHFSISLNSYFYVRLDSVTINYYC